MRKAAIRHGDPTTTRGVVIAYSSHMNDKGRKIALSGDEATCGNCKGAYKIYGTGTKMTEKSRSVVLEGDIVLCPCNKNRVIAGSDPGVFVHMEEDSAGADPVQRNDSSASDPTASEQRDYTKWFLVRDRETGKPLAGRDFVARVGGVKQTGKTDSLGYAKISADREQAIDLHIVFSTPKRNLRPEILNGSRL
jgi:uncharacterized Zn-binding protein involved in type VI secretion